MIILYKSNHCPHCRQIEDILQVCDIPYEARNVTEKPDYKRRLRSIGVRSLPVLEYGDIVITDTESMINWVQNNEISLKREWGDPVSDGLQGEKHANKTKLL